MKKIAFILLAMLCPAFAFSQNTLTAIIKDHESNQALIGATARLVGTGLGASSDASGQILIENIPDGRQVLQFRFIGYLDRTDTLSFPLTTSGPLIVHLQAAGHEMEEVFVSATRSSRTIEDIPTRVEVIAGEELEEKGNMKPGDIRMLLNESTGIQTQQTSATSYNSSIRIQGLDGRYTQIIRDGFPLYSGFSGGLGLLQIAPLDLRQVEVIKGAASTLYGGGAIAGLVNLVSKTPGEERELSFLLNGTSALGLDASGFYSERKNKVGATVFAAYNHGTPYDPAGIGFTAIPEFDRFTLNPKLFVYLNEQTSFSIGVNSTFEERTGGDIDYIQGDGNTAHTYFEKNETSRVSTQASFDHAFNPATSFNIKNSLSYYDRSIRLTDYLFSGLQLSGFSEASLRHNRGKSEWVAGLNYLTDRFEEDKVSPVANRDYNYTTVGLFAQNNWDISDQFSLETGLRGDYQNEYGFFLLPRLSALWKANSKLSARLGGGAGYKTPNIFTEEAERIQFRDVLPIDVSNTEAERSLGGNFDVNYRTALLGDRVTFSINGLLFYTRINDPIVLSPVSTGLLQFRQPDGFIDTKGLETNIKITYQDFKLFTGYTLADVQQHNNGAQTDYTLVARHRLNNVLMYEIEEKLKLGLEAYYYGPQKLSDGAQGKSYWITGFMAERIWEHFSLFLNFENFLDTRQTGFDTIYTGTRTNPVFRDIYAPVDGFVVNGGIKIRL
jgi:outer membrane receptor for ferrienterochelin and colicins